MKRKIIFIAMIIALLSCLFAITAYSAEIPEWTAITTIEGMPDKSVFGDDGKAGATSRVLMSDGVTYPAYYICKNATTLGISFSDLNTKASKSYTAADVIRIEIPKGTVIISDALKVANKYTALLTVVIPDGATTINAYALKSPDASTHSSLVSVTIPDTVTSIGKEAFAYCNSLEELIIPDFVSEIPESMARDTTSLVTLKLPANLQSIGKTAFRSANLSGGVVIPEGCTTIGDYAFKACSAESASLPSTLETLGTDIFTECHSLTTVYSKSPIIGVKMFYDCDELVNVTLENTIEICEYAFCNPSEGILKITNLELPEGLTTIEKYAFIRSQITSLVLPSTLTTIGQFAFASSTNLTKVVALNSCFGDSMFQDCGALNELVLTEKFTTLGGNALGYVSQDSFITYYTGTDYDRIKSVCSATTRLSNAKYYSYEDYKNENYTYNSFMVIYDANLCEVAYNSVHKEDGNPCVVNCDRCGISGVAEENPVHSETVSVVYNNGYNKTGSKITGCQNEGCTHVETTEVPAIFIANGYSTNADKNAINGGYTVDFEALDFYKSKNGNLKYGIIIANAGSFSGEILDASHKVTSKKAIQVEINSEYANFNCTINYGSNVGADLELVITAYTIDKDGNVTFIQADSVYAESQVIGSSTLKKITLQKVVANQPSTSDEE